MPAIINRVNFFWTSYFTTIITGTCMSVRPGVLSLQAPVIIGSKDEAYLFF